MKFKHSIKHLFIGALLGGVVMAQPAYAEILDSPALKAVVQEAQKLIDADKLEEAQKVYLKYIEANSNDGVAQYRIAEFYLEAGAAIAAQTSIEKARSLGVSSADSAVLLAKAYLGQQKYSEAEKELDGVTIAADQLYDALIVRGDSKMGQKLYEEAVVQYSEAIIIDATRFNGHLGMAQSYLRMRQHDQALESITRALEVGSDQSGVHFTAGLISRAFGRSDDALGYFSTAIDLYGRNIVARLERASLLVDMKKHEEAQKDLDVIYSHLPGNQMANYISAVILSHQGDFAGAEKMLQSSHDLVEGFLPAQITKGFVAYQLGNYATAVTYLSRVIDAVPGHNQVRMVLAAAQLKSGRPADALITLAPVENGDEPLDGKMAGLLGTIYMNLGDAAKGTEYLTIAAESQPENEEVLTRLALGQHAIGEDDAAVAGLENIATNGVAEESNMRAAILLALIERGRGNYAAARKAARILIESRPEDPVGYNIMGVIDLSEKKYAEAEEKFLQALDLEPKYFAARRNLAEIYETAGKLADAERELRRVLGDSRDDIRAVVALARLKVKQSNFQAAVDFARQAVDLKSDAERLRFLLADALLANNNIDEAHKVMLAAERDFPNSSLIGRKLGQIQILSKDFDGAIGTYGRLLDNDPDNTDLYREYGNALLRAGFSERSRLVLLRGRDIATEKGLSTLGFLADLVTIEKSLGNYEAALTYAHDIRKLYPDAEISGVVLGEIYMANKQYENAIAAYGTALDAGMDSSKLRIGLATSQNLSGDTISAKKTLADWIANNPEDALARVALGDIYLGSGDNVSAIAQYERILADGHDNPIILNNLAWAYMQVDDRRAKETAERAYNIGHKLPEFADTLGWILLRMENNPSRAITLFQEAIKGKPFKAIYHYHLGLALLADNKSAEALNALVKATDLSQKFDGYEDARSRITQMKASE